MGCPIYGTLPFHSLKKSRVVIPVAFLNTCIISEVLSPDPVAVGGGGALIGLAFFLSSFIYPGNLYRVSNIC